MADPKMAPPFFSKAETGNKYRNPLQGTDPVHMLTCLHTAEAQASSRANTARPRTDDHRFRADDLPAGGQGRVNIDRFKITAKSMPAGYGPAEQPFLLQLMNAAAELYRQSGSVGHDIGDPAGRPVIFDHRHRRGKHAVQLADEHGDPPQAFEPGQLPPVACCALLAAEHPHLPGGIAEFHDMTGTAKRRRRPAEIELDKMVAPAAQRQIKGGCIQ